MGKKRSAATIPKLKASDAVNLFPGPTGREHLSVTKLSSWLACPMKFALHYESRLEPVARKESLSLGRAFQQAIEANDPVRGAEAYVSAQTVSSQEDEDAVQIGATVVACAATAYLDKWPAPDGEAREFPFRVRLRSPWSGQSSRTWDLLGYADGLRDLGQGWELVENKFVGQITPLSVKRIALDRQLALESYGIWRATGKPVTSVTYRFTRKPSIRPRKEEPVADFMVRLATDYRDRRDDFYTHEERLYFDTSDLLRTECELWTWGEALHRHRGQGFFPRNTSACSDFGGCQFLPICTGDPDALDLYREREHSAESLGREILALDAES